MTDVEKEITHLQTQVDNLLQIVAWLFANHHNQQQALSFLRIPDQAPEMPHNQELIAVEMLQKMHQVIALYAPAVEPSSPEN